MEAWYLIRDIDAISEQLKILQDNNVTVLWRPLHEASGGWFWWGCRGKDAYQWLWNLMYERQTHYHKLNNLIWVWNGQDPDWYVGMTAATSSARTFTPTPGTTTRRPCGS